MTWREALCFPTRRELEECFRKLLSHEPSEAEMLEDFKNLVASVDAAFDRIVAKYEADAVNLKNEAFASLKALADKIANHDPAPPSA